MTITQRRLTLSVLFAVAALGGAVAYYMSLVPATHPDHDHGIMNLDAGGRILVVTRTGEKRNLVGRPGHPLVLHFFSTKAPGAAEELAALFAYQPTAPSDVEFLLIAEEPDFATLDAWLAANRLTPPVPASLVLDPDGETTRKMNSKRPLETMYFTADGKLASQAKGPENWAGNASSQIAAAKGGASIE